jgi:hypothetical protein
MPTYEIQGPDGKTYSIDGPEGASREEVIAAIQARMQTQPAAPAPKAEAPKPAPAPKKAAPVEGAYGAMGEGIDDTVPAPAPKAKPAAPAPQIDPTTGKPYPEAAALSEPSVWDRIMMWGGENKAKAQNEYAARRTAAERGITINQAYKITSQTSRPIFNPEGRQLGQASVEAGEAIAKSLPDAPEAALNTALRAIRAGDIPVENRTWLDKAITFTTQDPKQGDLNTQAFANVGQSLGYSAATMVASAIAGSLGTATAGPIGGVVAGFGTSAAVSYGASKDEFLSRLKEKLDKDSKNTFERPLNEAEWESAKKEFNSAATKYGAWEAVPEALSNLIFLKVFLAPVKAARTVDKVVEYAKRAVVSQPPEHITETITALGQNKAELEAKLTKEELNVRDAFKQQFIQTLAIGGGMAVGAATAQQVNKFYETYVEPKVRPGSALAKAIQADLTDYMNQPARQQTPMAATNVRPSNVQPPETVDTLNAAPPAPPADPREQVLTQAYAQEGIPPEQAAQVAQQSVAALNTPPAQPTTLQAAQAGLGLPVTEGQDRVMQRSSAEDEARTTAGRAERAALQAEASNVPSTEPPSYVTEPSTGEQGIGLPSEPTGEPTGRPRSAIERGLDTAERLVGSATSREEQQRPPVDAHYQSAANVLAKAFRLQALPNLAPVFGVGWQQQTMASNPTPEQFEEAAYNRLEELRFLGQRVEGTPVKAKPAAAPKVEAAKPVEEKKETAKPVVYERGAYIPASTKGADPVASAGMRKLNEDDDLYDAVGPATIISGMDVKGRGEGVGKKLLSGITEWADQNNQRLVLVPAAQPDATTGGLNQEQLKEWYARNGFEDRADYMVREAKIKEEPSVTEAPKAEQAKKERPKAPAAKPAAPAVEEDRTESLELLATRNEALEVEEEEKALLGINDHLKKWFGTTADGLLRKRAKGAGPKKKPDTAKTDEERQEQLEDINKLNRDAETLIKATDKYTPIPESEQDGSVEQRERGRTGQYPTEAEYDYAEALRLHRLDLMRMALHALALRSRSRPIKGYSAAAEYLRKLKPAERERAKALWEGTVQPTALPVKPKATLTRAQLERFRAGEKLSKRGRPKKEKTEAVAKTKKAKEAKALAEAREINWETEKPFDSTESGLTEEDFNELHNPPREDTGSKANLMQLFKDLGTEGVLSTQELKTLENELTGNVTVEQEQDLYLQLVEQREAGKEVPPSKAQEEVEDRTIHDELDDDEKKTIAKHYGESSYNEVAQKKFVADVILALNEGLDAVSRVLHDIIKRLQASVLAGIMVMNTSFMTPPMRVAVPTTETRTVQVLAEVPVEAKGMSKAGELAFKNIFPAIQADLKRDNKLFVLTDKPSATVFVFNPDGSLLVQSKVLLGKTLGDYYVGNTEIDINKITPAGLFTLGLRDAARGITERGGDERKTASHYDFGKVFVLDKAIEGKASVTLFHSVWTHEKDAPKRLAALKKAGPEDSRYSFGCINLDKNVYGDLIANHQDQMDGAKMFVVPDEQAATMDFIRGKAITKGDIVRQSTPEITKTITERVPPATSRAEERKTPATLRKEQVAFGRRRRAKTEEGGATDLGMEPLAARRNTSTDAFKAWFRDSVVRDRDGEPKVMYHGTAQDIHEFRAKQAGAIFITEDPKFAESFGFNSEFYMMKELFNTATPEQRKKWIMDAAKYALAGENIDVKIFNEIKQSVSQMDASFGLIPPEVEPEVYAALKELLPSRNNVVPVYVSAQNPFDYENPKHTDALAAQGLSKPFQNAVLKGDWSVIENETVQDAIKAAGFDGFYVLEGGYKNLAVYEPTQIKSVFNKGTYDPTDSRILASQARDREIAEQQLDMEPDPFFNELESIGGALAYIAGSPNKLESELALRLLAPDNRAALKDVQFVVVEKDDKTIPRDIKKMLNTQVDGYYVPDTKGGTVYVRGLSYGERTQGINKEIVLHEAFHAAGAKKIEYAMLAKRLGFPVDKNLSEAVQELEDLMGRAKAAFDAQGSKANTHLKFLDNADAFTNIQEFYAYGMTDSTMKSFLLNDVSGVIEKTSGFDALINAVLKLFGINPKLKSGLKDLVLISHEIMQAQQPSGTELANRLKEANTEIRLAAKRQAKATATAERDLKASQSPSAIIGSVSAMQSSARDFGVIGTFMENNFTSMKVGVLRTLLNIAPTSTLFKIGTTNGITRLDETKQLIRARGAMRMGIQKEMEAIVSRWRTLSQKQLDLLADTMHLSTDLQEDPSLPVQYSGRIGVRSQELRNLWQQLAQVPDGHKLYKDVRDFYKKAAATFIANLKQQIATSALTGNINDPTSPKGRAFQEIIDTYEAGIGTGPYFPLMRQGTNWARFGKRGDVNFQLRENANDLKQFINAQIKERKRLGDKRNMEELRAAGDADFGYDVKVLQDKLAKESTSLRKIFKAIDSATSGAVLALDELKKDIFQMHLLLLPEESFRKMFIPRKNRAGYNRDALQNFVLASSRLSNQLAGSRYNRRISDSLTAAMDSLSGMAGKEKFELLVKEIEKRTENILKPPEQQTGEDFVRMANKFSFMYLLTDFRQAANNLWSLPSKGLPTLVKYFGEVATLKELTSVLFGRGLINQVGVTKTDANGKVTWHAPSMSLSPMVKNSNELRRVAEIMEAREINGGVSMTSDVYLASKGQSITTAERIGEAIIRTSGALHQGSERAAREMLFWSAYLLSRKQGLPMLKAIDKAQNIVEEALFRYAPDEMPPWANKPFPKLMFQFQKFAALNTNFYVVNTLEATGAMPSDVQAGAAKALLGAYMMAILATGIGGAFGVSMMIYLFGVVDGAWEKYANKNLKQSLMNMSPLRWFKEQYLVEKFGAIKLPGTDKTLADGLADGFLDTYTGIKLSSGVSEGSLWFGEPPTALDVQVWLEYLSRGAQDAMLAPSLSTLSQEISGLASWVGNEGAWSQEVEKAIPLKFLRNIAVSKRLETEGYKDRDYDTIIDANEFTKGQLFAQAYLGFRPQAMADIQEANYFIAKNEKMIYNKRNALIDSWVISAKKNDFDALVRTNKKIDEFNQMFPYHEKLLVMPDKLVDALDANLEKALGKERGRQVLDKPEFDWIESFRDSAKLKIIENRGN